MPLQHLQEVHVVRAQPLEALVHALLDLSRRHPARLAAVPQIPAKGQEWMARFCLL